MLALRLANQPQPLTAIALVMLALALLRGLAGAASRIAPADGPVLLLVALFLSAGVVAAGMRPIHIRHNIKVTLTTVPLFALALLVPPPVAAAAAGVSIFVTELLTRQQRGNTPADIATSSSRWVLVLGVCSLAAQSAIAAGAPMPLVLVGAAVGMFLCDVVTAALEIGPMSGEAPVRLMGLLLREGFAPEMVQYMLGILLVLAASQQPWSLVLWLLPLVIVYQSFRHAKEMHDGTGRLLESLADAVDLRDAYTGGHSRRVTELSICILDELAMVGPEVELIRSAARVHDIGKIGIPDSVLNKPGQLTDEEKRIMDSHPDRGAELLLRHRDFARGVAIVRHHHERWDGKGYPTGLAGLDIPFGARVIAVADSFDAMTSDRPYRTGMPVSRAIAILREGSGTQWDPAIVDALLRSLERQPAVGAPRPCSSASPQATA